MQPTSPSDSARLSAQKGQVVPNSYIILLKPELSVQAIEAHISWASDLFNSRSAANNDASLKGVTARYSMSQLKGYAGSFDEATIDEIKASDDVAKIEKNQVLVAAELTIRENVGSWGLARVSQQSLRPDLNTFYYDSSAGDGTTAYVIDTGVWVTHEEFEDRATFGANFTTDPDTDGNGHGTHVSGTIGGKCYGVAPKARIIGVKVLDDDGTGWLSDVISGIQWAVNDATDKQNLAKSVANMSLGGSYSEILNLAVASGVRSGLLFVVAAGNDNEDVANYSPASERLAITVGATDTNDTRTNFSNYGELLDVFAPGYQITSAWQGADNAVLTISGTSMASPHVAGTAAYLIALEGPGDSGPDKIAARIKELSVDAVLNPGPIITTSLLYTGAN